MADEVKTKSEPTPPRFKITNVVRRVNNRLRRAAAPGRRRFKQFVCGKRLLRKQSIWVTPEEMEKHQAQLMEQVREGAIEILTPDGVLIYADIHGRIVGRRGQEVMPMDEGGPKGRPKQAPKKELVEEPQVEAEPTHAPPPPPDPAKEETPTPPKSDDLTELPGVGAGRARKLEAAGITTFKQIAEMSPGDLVKILGSPVTEDQASDICDAASEKEEG